jgi:AhpD family alkylhydroperoxidase
MSVAVKLIDPSQNEFLASLEAKAKHPNPFFRAMANRPDVLKNYVPFYVSVVGQGSVDRRVKSLVYMTCSYANECPFCVAANTAGAKKAGVTDDEMQWLQTEQDQNFSAAERAAILYARELTQMADAEDTRAALAEHFTSEQIVEITLVIGIANLNNRFNNGLNILPED